MTPSEMTIKGPSENLFHRGRGGGGVDIKWNGLIAHVNPLSPNSDENGFCLKVINTCSNVQVMRKKKVITKDKMS